MTRLVKADVIRRAAHMWYENPFTPPSVEEISMVIRYPSYLSMEYALSKHGVISQATYMLTLISTKLPYTYRTSQAVYEYHQICKSLFWGYRREGTVLTAEPEKALLDFIYIRCANAGKLPVGGAASLVNDMDLSEFNFEKLYQYSKKFSPRTRRILTELNILKT